MTRNEPHRRSDLARRLALAAAFALVPIGTPATPQAPGADRDQLALQEVEFDVATLDPTGREVSRTRRRAQQFVEALPGGVRLELVAIPAGRFRMGTSDDLASTLRSEFARAGIRDDAAAASVRAESPAHDVAVGAFLLGRFEVTRAQWRAVANLPRVARRLDRWPSADAPDEMPVIDVSWHEAVEFCARLSRFTGRTYRLPTEAEWEYACRAGTSSHFHFGDTITSDVANCWAERPFGKAPVGSCCEELRPVGAYGVANEVGLFDMHGNAAEWCRDSWHDSYAGAPSNGTAWTAGNREARRVVRGGSYYSSPVDCRSASRSGHKATETDDRIGLRVALELPPRGRRTPG